MAVPPVVAPSGNIDNNKSAFLLINICADCNSFLVILALLISFLGSIPNSSPVISGVWSFRFLKFKLSRSKLDSLAFIALSTLLLTPNLSDRTTFFLSGFTSVSVDTSSLTVLTIVSTSSMNSSPKILLDASMALAGKYLLMKAANGTPDFGSYSLTRSSIPRLPISISLVKSSLSKPGASLLFCTILFTIGLNCSIISKTPALPFSSYIR